MNTNRNIGNKGEKIAAEFLQEAGYEIVALQWTHGHKEIDIIARESNRYVFVEVKTRTNTQQGFPEEAISAAKIRSVMEAARQFLYDKEYQDIRFDVISILLGVNHQYEIFHIKDAFY
jgi:putative endonuclease